MNVGDVVQKNGEGWYRIEELGSQGARLSIRYLDKGCRIPYDPKLRKKSFRIKPPVDSAQQTRNLKRISGHFGNSSKPREHANTKDGPFETYDGKKYEVNSKGEIRKVKDAVKTR